MVNTRLLSAGLVTLGLTLLGVAPAQAAVGWADSCPSLAVAFCTAGTFSEPDGVAVDNSTGSSSGHVWVANAGNKDVIEFDASGNEIGTVSSSNIPLPALSFSAPNYVAVDPSNGDLYASDAGNNTVTKFDASGVFQFQLTGATCTGTCPPNPATESKTPQGSFSPLGVAVDPANGDLYVADYAHARIDIFTSAGVYVSQFEATMHTNYDSIAAGPNGNVYVIDEASGKGETVRAYGPIGQPVDCPSGSNVVDANDPQAVAIDPSNGDILVGENAAGGFQVVAYSAPCTSPFFTFGAGDFASFSLGLGVNGVTHTVYTGAGFSSSLGLIFKQVQLPDVTTGSATSVTRTSAVLSGTIDPRNMEVTGCRFDYGLTTAYEHTVPCEQTMPLTGNSPLTVTAEVSSLELPPKTIVHYRLDETDEIATIFGTNVGQDETFATEPLPAPAITESAAGEVSQFAATLHATIETGGGAANYHFVYGTTSAYGTVAPVPDAYTPMTGEPVAVSRAIGGLQANTTYHFALVASSPGGTTVGPDMTFTTPAIPAPSAIRGAVSGVTVGAATLTGAVDPHGWDTTYYFQYGTSTAYGATWPTAPVDMGALEGAQPVSIELQNLAPGTVYHYRLVASNGGGTSYGPDMTFTTAEYLASIIEQAPVFNASLLGFFNPEGATSSSRHGRLSCRAKAKRIKNARKRSLALRRCVAPKQTRGARKTKR